MQMCACDGVCLRVCVRVHVCSSAVVTTGGAGATKPRTPAVPAIHTLSVTHSNWYLSRKIAIWPRAIAIWPRAIAIWPRAAYA